MGLPALSNEDLPHYTYEDYKHWEGKWEVIHGIPFAMAPSPTKQHQWLSHRISHQLGKLLENCPRCHAYLPVDWQIAEDIIVQPDNMVICDDDPDEDKITVPPVLVFEILSPSTARKDKILKYRIYQEAGVKYYCMIDPGNKSFDVFTLKATDKFEKSDHPGGKITFNLGPARTDDIICKIDFGFTEVFNY